MGFHNVLINYKNKLSDSWCHQNYMLHCIYCNYVLCLTELFYFLHEYIGLTKKSKQSSLISPFIFICYLSAGFLFWTLLQMKEVFKKIYLKADCCNCCIYSLKSWNKIQFSNILKFGWSSNFAWILVLWLATSPYH